MIPHRRYRKQINSMEDDGFQTMTARGIALAYSRKEQRLIFFFSQRLEMITLNCPLTATGEELQNRDKSIGNTVF